MPAPTYSWNNIAATQTDADSPLDTTLMEAIRQDLIHLKEALYDTLTPAKAHNHDGVNSANVVLADSTVTLAKLKLLTGQWSLIGSSGGVTYYVAIHPNSHQLYGGIVTNATADGRSLTIAPTLNSPTVTASASQNVTAQQKIQITIAANTGIDDYYVDWNYHSN